MMTRVIENVICFAFGWFLREIVKNMIDEQLREQELKVCLTVDNPKAPAFKWVTHSDTRSGIEQKSFYW